jgi:ABC-type transport system involved in multi-copper enzyme maturation permease subunit
LIGLFGLLLLAAAVAGSMLAQEERIRLIMDGGLAGIQTIALMSMVFLGVTLLLDEVESRAICLMLARPAPRWTYLLGRYLGTAAAVVACIALMGLLHAACLAFYGWKPAPGYALDLAACALRTSLMGALAFALSLATTSAPSAMAFAAFLWVLGHFSAEIRLLGERSAQLPIQALCWAAARVVPDFSVIAAGAGGAAFGLGALYALLYSAVALWAAAWLFEEREI